MFFKNIQDCLAHRSTLKQKFQVFPIYSNPPSCDQECIKSYLQNENTTSQLPEALTGLLHSQQLLFTKKSPEYASQLI